MVIVAWFCWYGSGVCVICPCSLGIISHNLAMHAVAIAGIGLMTLAMMARVSLGHTGRSVYTPPKQLGLSLGWC